MKDNFKEAYLKMIIKDMFLGSYFNYFERKQDEKTEDVGLSVSSKGVVMRYNPAYFDKLVETYKYEPYLAMSFIMHNVLHVMFYHPIERNNAKFPDKDLYDICCDIEVNQHIDSTSLCRALKIPRFEDFPELKEHPKAGSEFYYNFLSKAMREEEQKAQGNGDGDGEGEGNGEGEEDPMKNFKKSKKKGVTDKVNAMKNGNLSNHDWDNKDPDGNHVGDSPDVMRYATEEMLREVLDDARKNRGTVPGFAEELYKGIIKRRKPAVDWRSFLKDTFSKSITDSRKITYSRTSKRFNSPIKPQPGTKRIRAPKVMLVVDTSGSVSQADFSEFFSEFLNVHRLMLKPEMLVVECDTNIAHQYEFKGKFNQDLKLHGRGGTDFNAPMALSHQVQPDLIIYFTDGYCPAPNFPPYRGSTVVWVVCSSGIDDVSHLKPGLAVKMQKHD